MIHVKQVVDVVQQFMSHCILCLSFSFILSFILFEIHFFPFSLSCMFYFYNLLYKYHFSNEIQCNILKKLQILVLKCFFKTSIHSFSRLTETSTQVIRSQSTPTKAQSKSTIYLKHLAYLREIISKLFFYKRWSYSSKKKKNLQCN